MVKSLSFEIEIGERLFNLITSSIIPIVYYEIRNKTNHQKHIKELDRRLKKIENSS